MAEWIENLMPNVVAYQTRFFTSLSQTLEMTVKSGILAFIFGLALGVILTVTRKGGIRPNAVVYRVIDILVKAVVGAAVQFSVAFVIWYLFMRHYRKEAMKMNQKIQEMTIIIGCE